MKSYRKMECGNSKEKIVDELNKLKFQRVQIQIERDSNKNIRRFRKEKIDRTQ